MNKHKSGFTLVELIVVIAIIGILATIALPKMEQYITEAKVRANIATARTIYTAAMAYNTDHLNDRYIFDYIDYTQHEMAEFPNPDSPEIPYYTILFKSKLSEYLPDNLNFVSIPQQIVADGLYAVGAFPDHGMPLNNPDSIIAVYYYDPRMPINSSQSSMIPNSDLNFWGTALVDGRAIVVTNLRFASASMEERRNPDIYPTVEEYIKEYNEYMENKGAN